jgi:hypothetical protein
MALWRRFASRYQWPFHQQHQDGAPGNVGYMLDLIADTAFDAYNRSLRPVSKEELFREFMLPADLPDDQDNPLPARDADAALAFLVEQGLVEVAGDTITVPARFWTEESGLS